MLLIPSAGRRDPIGCWVRRWHRHRLVLSQRRNPLSNECSVNWNQMESIQTRRFCCSSRGKKRLLFGGGRKVVNNLIVSTSFLSFPSLFFISHFSEREIVAVEYASERRRHKIKSFSHIGTKGGYQ